MVTTSRPLPARMMLTVIVASLPFTTPSPGGLKVGESILQNESRFHR
jgi:hypothetical protein